MSRRCDHARRAAAGVLAGLTLVLATVGGAAPLLEEVDVGTGVWPPYVELGERPAGMISRIVATALHEAGATPEIHYLEFGLVYRLTREGRLPLAYPFYRTAAREGEVLFSAPLATLESSLLYSTRFHDFASTAPDLTALRLGRVAGYSYGAQLDSLLAAGTVYDSDLAALRALIDGAIDLLPMSVEVAEALMMRSLPHHRHELRTTPQFTSRDPVYAIFPDTEAGRALRDRFDAGLARMRENGLMDAVELSFASNPHHSSGYVRLVPSEGYPVVIGQLAAPTTAGPGDGGDGEGRGADDGYFLIPQGTRGIVLQWSPATLQPGTSEAIYANMMELSLVRIVDGPQAGRELWVRNLHIAIE
jgi:polar amino acid transport system substrate-binding protein